MNKSPSKNAKGNVFREVIESICFFIVAFPVAIILWGWFSNVVMGKMTTGQYITSLSRYTLKLQNVFRRATDINRPDSKKDIEDFVKSAFISDDKYQFTHDLVEGMGLVYLAMTEFDKVNDPHKRSQMSDVDVTSTIMEGLYKLNGKMEEAKSLMVKHMKSKNRVISTEAMMIVVNYNGRIANSKKGLALLTSLENSYQQALNGNHFDKGTLLNEQSKLAADFDSLLESFTMDVGKFTNFLILPRADKNGKMDILDLTSSERNNLVNEIDQYFGDAAKSFNERTESRAAPAALLRHFLTGDGWKTKDKIQEASPKLAP